MPPKTALARDPIAGADRLTERLTAPSARRTRWHQGCSTISLTRAPFEHRIRHTAALAWRALTLLQEELENEIKPPYHTNPARRQSVKARAIAYRKPMMECAPC